MASGSATPISYIRFGHMTRVAYNIFEQEQADSLPRSRDMATQKRQRDDGDDSKTHAQLLSHKKRREYSESDAQLAKIYNDLADEIEGTRLKAASALIKHLSSDGSRNDDAINTALTRLVKGVNSGRKAARRTAHALVRNGSGSADPAGRTAAFRSDARSRIRSSRRPPPR